MPASVQNGTLLRCLVATEWSAVHSVERCKKMPKLSSMGLVVPVACLGWSLTIGVGLASAGPDLSRIVNTTCTYPQAMEALYDQSPEAAEQLEAYPVSFGYIESFFNSPVPQRQQMIQQAQALPATQEYLGLMLQIANTCHNY